MNSAAVAGEIRVAVASNFANTISYLADHFEKESGHKVTLILGSTGKHYAQIKNGAPFDIYFSADSKRPELLDNEGIALPNSRFTYALGKLILWSPKEKLVDKHGAVLEQRNFHHLAIANPKLAPYGRAAKEVLTTLKLWKSLGTKAVRGENIGQAFRFVQSGNAELGFIAYSQVKQSNHDIKGSYWNIPDSLYSPIKQQAVLLKDNDIARDFLSFIKSNQAKNIIKSFGYDIVQEE